MTVLWPVLAVVGLAAEAALAERATGVIAVRSGADPLRLAALLDALPRGAHRAVVSFGLAGGLDPALRPGDMLVAESLVAPDGAALPVDAERAAALLAALGAAGLPARGARLLGADAVLLTPRAKVAARAASGAAAVDMESHVAARFAAARGLPFAALRAVADPAARALPPLAARALRPDGGVDLGAVLKGLARAPGSLPALLRAGRDAGAGLAVLGRAAGALGVGLGV